jgi:5,10-methylenetetrahydromethanopterin reductase
MSRADTGRADESGVEIGLGLQGDKRPGDYAALARLAEAHGFDVLSVFGDFMFQPPIVPLLEMAAATGRVRLGAACWNPFSVHPYEIAGQLAALDLASGGRAYLGLAQGAWLDAVGIRRRQPVRALGEAVALITALIAGDDRELAGDQFPLAAGTRLRYPAHRPRVPVLIGAWGPRMAALAGRVADELKIGGTANPEMVGVLRSRIAVGAAEVGRRPDEVGIVVGAVTVVDEDEKLARARARTEVALYLGEVAHLDPTVTVPADLLTEVRRRVAAGDQPGAGDLIPDEVLDLFAFSGTPEQVAAQARRLIDAGVHRVEFGTPHGLTDAGGVDLLGSRVLPLLARRRGTRRLQRFE